MVAGFTLLLAKISALLGWFGGLAVAFFKAAWDFVMDAFVWPFDQFLSIAVSAVEAIPTGGITGALGAWGQLTADILNILAILGVGTAITVISAAIAIRMALQLIPFVRLGS